MAKMSTTEHERVDFRMIEMPCCKHMLCWVNPRLPNYCPECGTKLLKHEVRAGIILHDPDAILTNTP